MLVARNAVFDSPAAHCTSTRASSSSPCRGPTTWASTTASTAPNRNYIQLRTLDRAACLSYSARLLTARSPCACSTNFALPLWVPLGRTAQRCECPLGEDLAFICDVGAFGDAAAADRKHAAAAGARQAGKSAGETKAAKSHPKPSKAKAAAATSAKAASATSGAAASGGAAASARRAASGWR